MSLFFVDSASDLSVIDAKKLGIEMINLPYLKEGDRIEFDKNFDFLHKNEMCLCLSLR